MLVSNCPVVFSFVAPLVPAPVGGVNYVNSSLVDWSHNGTEWELRTCKPCDISLLDFSGWSLTGTIDVSNLTCLTSANFSNNDLTGFNFNACELVCQSLWSLNLEDNENLGFSFTSGLIHDICTCYLGGGGKGSVNLLGTFLDGSISNLDTENLYYQVTKCEDKNNVFFDVPLIDDYLSVCAPVISAGGCYETELQLVTTCGGIYIKLLNC